MVDWGFEPTLAGVLVDRVGLDPVNEADAKLAQQFLESGLTDVATVKDVTGSEKPSFWFWDRGSGPRHNSTAFNPSQG